VSIYDTSGDMLTTLKRYEEQLALRDDLLKEAAQKYEEQALEIESLKERLAASGAIQKLHLQAIEALKKECLRTSPSSPG
jgi:hypothetical protein